MEFDEFLGCEQKQTTMPFGKYRGEEISSIPSDYLVWLHDNANMKCKLKDAIEEVMLERFKRMVTIEKNNKSESLEIMLEQDFWRGEDQ